MSPTFTCRGCGKGFTVPRAALDKFPGWQPARCLSCKDREQGGGQRRRPKRPSRGRLAANGNEANISTAEVLERYTEGPFDGVFTDGACTGNPGPGGWGVVWVKDNAIVAQAHGSAPETTNNRMELRALIAAYAMLPEDAEETIYSDSQLCVNTITQWAAGWEKRGWRRKTGPIKNLELVKEAYALAQKHPSVKLRWIKAHNGSRWNEYADALATAFGRGEI